MTSPTEEIGACGFVDPSQEPAKECRKTGLRIIVRVCFSDRLCSIVRCRDHSDWIEATR